MIIRDVNRSVGPAVILVMRQIDHRRKGIPPAYNLSFVGHGLGGVFAVLGLLTVKAPELSQIEVYTYGEPRFVNYQFAHKLNFFKNLKIYRVTYYNDFIPNYPKSYQKAQYLHHGKELWTSPKDCDCATSINNGDNFNIYLCPGPKTTSGIKLESQECNGETEAALNEAFASHLGPYLGQMMTQCPPMVTIDHS
ncbi:hypothetical protein G9A89_018139 [Geosiphon pyriformis]|nr:hypothetical protein G9A89_018139 [Geosiphon pyriformis]